jgi:hypothetical protein
MNWILEHLQFVLAIVAGIAYWLNQQRAAAAEKTEAERDKTVQPASMAEADDAMRAEHVREAIRRKIATRREGVPEAARAERNVVEDTPQRKFELPPLMRPRPVSPLDPFGGPSRPAVRRAELEPVRPVELPRILSNETLEASLERQKQLAAKLQEYADQRMLVERRAAAITVNQAAVAQRALAGEELRRDLRGPRSLRRAMILREVLGTPVGLR